MAKFTSNSQMNFDSFPTNICEMFGRIQKHPVAFYYSRVEVWANGSCVHEAQSSGKIEGSVLNDIIHFDLNVNELTEYIQSNFTFEETSTTSNRLVWSKDMMNSKGIQYSNLEPSLVSLFFKNGELVKCAFNIPAQGSMVEFYK